MTPEPTIIVGICVVLATGILAAVSRHKKSATGPLSQVGSIGIVDKGLEPQGTVLIQGELWLAFSSERTSLPAGSKIKVVGTCDHLLLVMLRA
jgi:membrane-bound ClpP family serine protease